MNCLKTRQKNRCASEEKFKLYKLANKEAKSVNEANYKAYDTLYARLGSKKEKQISIGQLRLVKRKGGVQGVFGVQKMKKIECRKRMMRLRKDGEDAL